MSSGEWSNYRAQKPGDGVWVGPSVMTDDNATERTNFHGGLEIPEPYYPLSQQRRSGNSANISMLKNRLTWRLDPDESLSDWTLTVVSNPNLDQPEDDDDDHDNNDDNYNDGGGDDDDDDDDVFNFNDDNWNSRNNHQNREAAEDRNQEEVMNTRERSHASPPRGGLATQYATKKYFVHRTVLAVGPRRSEYFARLFHDQQRKKSGKKNIRGSVGTRIELRPTAAEVFPLMLDYIYSDGNTPPDGLCSETAVALRHMSTCFGIRPLFEHITQFIQYHLCAETAPSYLYEAYQFQHSKLLAAALQLCARHFETIQFREIVTKLTPVLLEQVVLSRYFSCGSEVLSTRIASYCRCRPGIIDAAILQRVTAANVMPIVAEDEALFFLQLIAEVEEDGDEDVNLGGRKKYRLPGHNPLKSINESKKKNSVGNTKSLYERCIEASGAIVLIAIRPDAEDHIEEEGTTVTSNRKGIFRKKKKKKTADVSTNRLNRNAAKEYNNLPEFMKVDVLEHALRFAPTPKEVTLLEQAKTEAQNKLAGEAQNQYQLMESEVGKLSSKYEKKIADMEARLVAQEQELLAYATELSKFQRVPNHHRFGGKEPAQRYNHNNVMNEAGDTVRENTYQRTPEFNDSGEHVYGQDPPTSMPRFGTHGADGWLFAEEDPGKETNFAWPVFYYKDDAF